MNIYTESWDASIHFHSVRFSLPSLKLTWHLKITAGKGDCYWKPSFLGAMLLSGRVGLQTPKCWNCFIFQKNNSVYLRIWKRFLGLPTTLSGVFTLRLAPSKLASARAPKWWALEKKTGPGLKMASFLGIYSFQFLVIFWDGIHFPSVKRDYDRPSMVDAWVMIARYQSSPRRVVNEATMEYGCSVFTTEGLVLWWFFGATFDWLSPYLKIYFFR